MNITRRVISNVTIECSVDESYEFVILEQFKKDAKKLGLIDSDIEELKHAIATQSPEASLGSGVYKFRWSPSRWNKGQSGSTRTIYVELIQDSRVYLVTIYAKNRKENLSANEEKVIRQLAKMLRKEK